MDFEEMKNPIFINSFFAQKSQKKGIFSRKNVIFFEKRGLSKKKFDFFQKKGTFQKNFDPTTKMISLFAKLFIINKKY